MKIDSRKAIIIIEFIVIIIPLIYPMSIPLPIDKYTQDYYDAIQEVPNGAMVGFNNLVAGASWPLLGSGNIRTAVELWEKDCKIIFFGTRTDGIPFIDILLDDAIKIYESRNPGEKIEYDIDYVELGYIAGEETGFAAFMSDVKGLIPQDEHGTPTSQLKMIKDVNDGGDFDFMVWSIAGVPAPYGLRQYVETYSGTMVEILVTMILPTEAPFLQSGQIAGAIIGSSACAQYEFLTGIPGPNVRLINALSLVSVMVILALVAGNVIHFYNKFTGGKT